MDLYENLAAVSAVGVTRAQAQPGHEGAKPVTSDWDEFYSDSKNYERVDLLDEEVYELIADTIRQTKLFQRFLVLVSFASLFLFLAFGALVLTGTPANARGANLEHVANFAENLTSTVTAFARSTSGSNVIATAIFFLVVGLMAQAALTLELWRQSNGFAALIARVKSLTKNSKQIYPGSGTLTFSFGSHGIAVSSRNVDLKIRWHAVSSLVFLSKEKPKWSWRPTIKYKEHISEQASQATHLMLFLESTNGSRMVKKDEDAEVIRAVEYLIIPKRFFESRRDANVWEDFVHNLESYKRKYDERRKIA